MDKLPVEACLPELKAVLRERQQAILVAPPGSGKTTRVPLALLNEPWLNGQKVVILEPRRLAARSAAQFMAENMKEPLGKTVGYRIRFDTKVSAATRVEVITEGILTRMLQHDPALTGIGMILFDEFHERSLQADLGLALVLEAQELFRPDLKVLVMSATLDVDSVAALLGQTPVIQAQGRTYPVETVYTERPVADSLDLTVARTVALATQQHEGDILVFLPGAKEIRQVQARLDAACLGSDVSVIPLYGNLPQSQQDLALQPSLAGKRKVVLATTIAETSLTVPGVRVVVDGGWKRVPKYSLQSGLTRLETVRVSQASADQRRGRAGREGPGICYRLWSKREEAQFQVQDIPEILEADLVPLTLELAAWGTQAEELMWLDEPPRAALEQARQLLQDLSALNGLAEITPQGRSMAELGIHPRLAQMILRAIPMGWGALACDIAALLSNRDLFAHNQGAMGTDFRTRLDVLQGCGKSYGSYDREVCRRVKLESHWWQQRLGVQDTAACDLNHAGVLLALAYPDRVGQSRGRGRFLLANGRGVVLKETDLLADSAYLVAVDLEEQTPEGRIRLGSPIDLSQIRRYLASNLTRGITVEWSSSAKAVRTRQIEQLGQIVLGETAVAQPDAGKVLEALLQGIRTEGLKVLPWNKESCQLQQRIQFLQHLEAEWPDVSDQYLLQNLTEWLAPYLSGMDSVADLQKLNLDHILENLLSWDQKRRLDEAAPKKWLAPSGRSFVIDYSDPDAPAVEIRLQELFGLAQTPCIAQGNVALTLRLLSPALRPVQVTRDLAGFWENTYFLVKKELMGRYPKHHWPDNPLTAKPGSRVRPKN